MAAQSSPNSLISISLFPSLSALWIRASASPDGCPEFTKLAHINLLVSILVRLVDQSICLTSTHVASNLVHKSLQFFAIDFAIAVGVKQLEGLLKLLLADI